MYTDADEILQEEINQYKVSAKEGYLVFARTSFHWQRPLQTRHQTSGPPLASACRSLAGRGPCRHGESDILASLLDFEAVCEFNLPRKVPGEPPLVTVAL